MKNQIFYPPSINYTSCSRCCINHAAQPPIKNILHQSSSVPSSAIHQLSGVATLLHDASHRPIVDQPFYLSANIRHPSPTRDVHDAAIIIPPDHVSSILLSIKQCSIVSHPSTIWGVHAVAYCVIPSDNRSTIKSANIRHPSITRHVHDAQILRLPDHLPSLHQSSSRQSSIYHLGCLTLLHVASHRLIGDQLLNPSFSICHPSTYS